MSDTHDPRLRLLEAGNSLFQERGYCATGINEILLRSGVPKGSFYHYFKSKFAFCVAVLDVYQVEHEGYFDVLQDNRMTPARRLEVFFRESLSRLEDNAFLTGCLVGRMSQEIGHQSDAVRQKINLIFDEWEDRIAQCLKPLFANATAIEIQSLSAYLWNGWEGAILRAKAQQSRQPLEQFIDVTLSRLLSDSANRA